MATGLKPYTWLQPDGKGGKQRIDMRTMDDITLQKTFIEAANKEFEFFQLHCTFNSLTIELLEVAQERGLRLIFPDEKFKTLRFGNYFKNWRKNEDIDELNKEFAGVVEHKG